MNANKDACRKFLEMPESQQDLINDTILEFVSAPQGGRRLNEVRPFLLFVRKLKLTSCKGIL